MKIRYIQPGFLGIGILCLAFTLSFFIHADVSAQTPTEDNWTQPTNLSNSGSATTPMILVDSDAVTHAIWLDALTGYRHIQSEADGQWSQPNSLTLPFNGIQPRVLTGPEDMVYTFWLDEGRLLTSRVKSVNVGFNSAWEPAVELAVDVMTYDVSADADQIIHLAYVTQSDREILPAGVYYRQRPVRGNWSAERTIYTSLYFRTLPAEQAHVSVAAGNLVSATDAGALQKTAFVAWDEPYRFSAVLSSTTDGGYTWETPRDIDPDTAVKSSLGTFEPDLAAWKDQVLLVWQKTLSETNCEMMVSVISAGQEWSSATRMFSSSLSCAESSSFFAQREDALLWQTVIQDQVILAAWDGERWSEPQTQMDLASFWDAAAEKTLQIGYRSLFYQADVNSLLSIGCDVNGSQDIWLTKKSLDDLEAWYLPLSSWLPPQKLTSALYGVNNVTLTADGNGNFHSFWVQIPAAHAGAQPPAANADEVGVYVRWDGEKWSEPSAVLTAGQGSPLELATITDSQGNLTAIWRGETGCQIYFSRAPGDRAFSAVEWMEPVQLPAPSGTCSAPVLAAGSADTLYAAYAVVVNEGRGIYINRSLDGGRTWEDPIQVFDAQAAAWEMVDQPELVVSGSRLHVLWQHGSPLNLDLVRGLGYAVSTDGGQSWSAADASVEASIRWSALAAASDGTLLRVWQQESADQPLIVTQVSDDDGNTWRPPVSIASFGDILGNPALITDPAGGVHLIQISRDYLGKVSLRHWMWSDANWMAAESMNLGFDTRSGSLEVSGVISHKGQLAVLYTLNDAGSDSQSVYVALSQVEREAALPERTQAALASPTADNPAVVQITQTQPANLTVIETATAALTDIAADPPETGNTWIGPIVGILLAAVIVVGVFWVRLNQTKA